MTGGTHETKICFYWLTLARRCRIGSAIGIRTSERIAACEPDVERRSSALGLQPVGPLLVAAELLSLLRLLPRAALPSSPVGPSRLAPSRLAPVVTFLGASAPLFLG